MAIESLDIGLLELSTCCPGHLSAVRVLPLNIPEASHIAIATRLGKKLLLCTPEVRAMEFEIG